MKEQSVWIELLILILKRPLPGLNTSEEDVNRLCQHQKIRKAPGPDKCLPVIPESCIYLTCSSLTSVPVKDHLHDWCSLDPSPQINCSSDTSSHSQPAHSPRFSTPPQFLTSSIQI
ncbi:hypothetical protein ATANTOWER_005556 [Ataeniobius toweri]|uniref:Uncharacterized protein n=1 Tax=Ataeniobius toweri TaxID=208326 RepID=A0ABU7AF73_9TELE|nr:hypothetical protein [Ataeniobius toweri]